MRNCPPSSSLLSALRRPYSNSSSENWVSSNDVYKRNPKLQILEKCAQRPRLLLPALAYTLISGLFLNPFVSSRVLHFSCLHSPQDLSFPLTVFRQIKTLNLFSWNTMIKNFAEAELHSSSMAFSLYTEMLSQGFLPDKHTYPFILLACRSPSMTMAGRLLHSHSIILGFSEDIFICTALMRMYFRCGDSVSALEMFDEMPTRDVVSWGALISGLVKKDEPEEALKIFNSMRKNHMMIDITLPTMLSVLAASANLGSLNPARALHALVEKIGFRSKTFVNNSLINGYSKCGSIAESAKIFWLIEDKDLLSWTSMISGFATNGMAMEALRCFVKMISAGVLPDRVTFLIVLSACSHGGMINEGVEGFDTMMREFKISPSIKHYGCMVDLFARAGRVNLALDLVSKMPMKPSYAMLGALLSACREEGEMDIAEVVIEKMASFDEKAGGASALLAGMYAEQCRWEEALMVRKMEREGGERKHYGQSWIELEGVVHRFEVRDGVEPHLNEIVSALNGFMKDGSR